MKAGKVLKYLLKLAISGILALVILSVFCLFYFNPPMPTPQFEEYSNTKYIENRYWVALREGFGFGRTNELGYNDAPISDPTSPRIAVIGSSHTVALQVDQKDNYVMSLERLLLGDSNSENDFECMNLASAGQFFDASVSNLEPLAQSFDNLEYVILESPLLNYSEEEFAKMLRGEYHVEPESDGLLYRAAQSIPFLRLMANQYQGTQESTYGVISIVPEGNPSSSPDYGAYERGFRPVAEMLASIADEYGFKLIILHHGAPLMDSDHSTYSAHDAGNLEILQSCCEDNEIYFVDMCQSFSDHYNATLKSAYGFANTTPGSGHLNKVGHSLIAQTLYEKLNEIMEEE